VRPSCSRSVHAEIAVRGAATTYATSRGRRHVLAPDDDCVGDARQRVQGGFDLGDVDPVAADLHLEIAAPEMDEVAVGCRAPRSAVK
jgi:hypothetical protein